MTLRAYSKGWLESRDLRPTTRAKYRHLLDRHILPAMGDTALAKLTPEQVRTWWAKLASEHPSTAAGGYLLLSTICRTAVDDERIARSPCKIKGGATERATERPVATLGELSTATEACPAPYRLALLLAAWGQLRRGEILGLQRQDVDLAQGTVTISRNWCQVSDGSTVLGPPKTEAGVRVLAIPSNVVPAMKAHLDGLKHLGPDAWLFPSAAGKVPVSPRTLDRVWEIARQAIGRPDIRLHDLRHTGLTLSAATGASTAELMRRGGHSSPAAALRYQHATTDRDHVLADKLGALASTTNVVQLRRTKDGRSSRSARRSSAG